jgi:hypothetical protein
VKIRDTGTIPLDIRAFLEPTFLHGVTCNGEVSSTYVTEVVNRSTCIIVAYDASTFIPIGFISFVPENVHETSTNTTHFEPKRSETKAKILAIREKCSNALTLTLVCGTRGLPRYRGVGGYLIRHGIDLTRSGSSKPRNICLVATNHKLKDYYKKIGFTHLTAVQDGSSTGQLMWMTVQRDDTNDIDLETQTLPVDPPAPHRDNEASPASPASSVHDHTYVSDSDDDVAHSSNSAPNAHVYLLPS